MSTYPRAQGRPEKPWGRSGADGRQSRAGRLAGQGRKAGLQGSVALPFGRVGSEPRQLRAPLLRPLLPSLRRSSRRSLPAWQLAKPLPCASGSTPRPQTRNLEPGCSGPGRGESPRVPRSRQHPPRAPFQSCAQVSQGRSRRGARGSAARDLLRSDY